MSASPRRNPRRQGSAGRVLLTGATGYVGGRLLRSSKRDGPCAAWCGDPGTVGRAAVQTEIVCGDVLEPGSLYEALAGVTTAYYLVHSMAASGPFAGADRRGAENFAAAAPASGVRKIVYLGGLGAEQDCLDPSREPSRGRTDPARELTCRLSRCLECRDGGLRDG